MHRRGSVLPYESLCWVVLISFGVHLLGSENYRFLWSAAVVTSVAALQALQGVQGEHSGGADGCRCLQAAGMPDGFLIDSLVLFKFFITSSFYVCQRCSAEGLSFGLAPAKSSSDEYLYTCVLWVWFMNVRHKEQSLWQQKQIMKEIEWSNLRPFSHH